MTDVLVVLLWQLVLFGGWATTRRLRALERRFKSPCYGQVGALREQIVELRTDQAFDVQEQARRLRVLEMSAHRAETDVRELITRHERASRALLAHLARVERSLNASSGPADARPPRLPLRGDEQHERRNAS